MMFSSAEHQHDLPAIARKERAAFYLTDMAKHLLSGQSRCRGAALPYLAPRGPGRTDGRGSTTSGRYRQCGSASPAARTSTSQRRGDVPRARVLSGGSALAGLAGALWDGKVPGVAARAPEALVHYAVLFGRSPEGAAIRKPLPSEMGRYMQTLAWQFVTK